MSRAATTGQSLYEDASLRGDLTDDEASPLLAWAVDRLKHWDADPDLTDSGRWEARVSQLKGVVAAAGKFAALRTYAPEGDQRAALAVLAERAAALGWPLPVDAVFEQQAALDGPAAIALLTRTLLNAPAETHAASAEPPTEPPAHPRSLIAAISAAVSDIPRGRWGERRPAPDREPTPIDFAADPTSKTDTDRSADSPAEPDADSSATEW